MRYCYPDGLVTVCPERTLDVSDVPAMFADRYKVHNVEMQHNYFESTEPSYFRLVGDSCCSAQPEDAPSWQVSLGREPTAQCS